MSFATFCALLIHMTLKNKFQRFCEITLMYVHTIDIIVLHNNFQMNKTATIYTNIAIIDRYSKFCHGIQSTI